MPAAPGVLVVEDEALIALLARDALEEAGFAVEVACDAAGALAALERGAHGAGFAAAVVDLGLPDRPGTVVLARLREAAPGTRVVVSTGYPDPGPGPDPSPGPAEPAAGPGRWRPPPGAAAVLGKPWTPEELVAAVRGGAAAPTGPGRGPGRV